MIWGPLVFLLTSRMTARIRSPVGVVLRARLFPPREQRLHAIGIDDDVAVLETLDGAVDHLADPVGVEGVDVVALRLADLLEDDLFRRLGRDAAQYVGRLGELDLHVDFRLVAVQLLRLGERNLRQRIRVTSSTICRTENSST